MNRGFMRVGRRWSSAAAKPAVSGSNDALKAFLIGGLFGGAALKMLGGSGEDSMLASSQQKQIAELKEKLKSQGYDAAKTQELRMLSDDFLQCTKGSDQLTGEMESMATRLSATQEELISSRKRMDELTKQNESYLHDLTDRIQAKVQANKATSVSFVTDKGDLVAFRQADNGLNVTVGGKQIASLKGNIPYDEEKGSIALGSKNDVQLPKDRREIVVGQLATLAENSGLTHNLVGNHVEFSDADGDRIKFRSEAGKLTVEIQGGVVAPLSALTFDKETNKLDCGGVGTCVLQKDSASVLQRLRRLAEKTKYPHDL